MKIKAEFSFRLFIELHPGDNSRKSAVTFATKGGRNRCNYFRFWISLSGNNSKNVQIFINFHFFRVCTRHWSTHTHLHTHALTHTHALSLTHTRTLLHTLDVKSNQCKLNKKSFACELDASKRKLTQLSSVLCKIICIPRTVKKGHLDLKWDRILQSRESVL